MSKATKRLGKLVDAKYWGTEPTLSEKPSRVEILRVYNWYNYNCSDDDAKDFVIDFLEARKVDASFIKKVKEIDAHYLHNIGWNCRILIQGGKLPEELQVSILTKLKTLVAGYVPKAKEEPTAPEVKLPLKKDRSFYLMSGLEELLDAHYTGKLSEDYMLSEWFIVRNVQASEVSPLEKHIAALIAEMQAVQKGKDEQLKEAYPSKVRNADTLAFLLAIQDQLNKRKLVVSVSKKKEKDPSEKKPRKVRVKKEKPAAKIVAKMHYLPDAKELGKSVAPESIIKASQVWLYNVKTRKLTVLNAETDSGLMVKGSSIIGWNEKTSEMKRIRKPPETIKALNEAGKVTLRKFMEGIKTSSNKANGRVNKDTLIVKVVK